MEQVKNILLGEGYIHLTKGYVNKGSAMKGIRKYSITEDSRIRRKMEEEVLEPTAKIWKYVSNETFYALWIELNSGGPVYYPGRAGKA